MPDKKLPFTAHLAELRNRIFKSLAAAFIGFLIAYVFKEEVFAFLMRPLIRALPADASMIYTGVMEAFLTYFKVSIYSGILIAWPFILYQIWAFVAPGLYQRERREAFPFIFYSTVFFLAGAAFAYFVLFPVAFKFLLSFGQGVMKPFPTAREYLSFTVKLLLALGLVFQFPVVALMFSRLGILSASSLTRNRRLAIIIFFVAAAVITPPDIVSQIMVAAPLIGLYELTIILVKLGARGG